MSGLWNSQNPKSSLLLRPSKWISLYEEFVTENSSSVGQLESALRSLTYIIPGLFIRTLNVYGMETDSFLYRAIPGLGDTLRMWYA
jgi:hypothetical protein